MPNISDLKIAVVGAGLIGRKHVDLVTRHARLSAIIDPDPKVRDLAVELGAAWFNSLEACLSDHQPDGAIVASPNQLHLDHGTTCLKAGLPVLIEKPLADTAEAARTLAEMSDAIGTPILVGHHRRHSPVIDSARAIIAEGLLGQLVTVNAMFWLNKPDDYFDVEWRRQPGGGPTYINLIHDIDLLQYLCGPITHVQAREASAVRGFDVEDTSAVILEFKSGMLGTVSISDAVSAPWSWELTAGENPAYPQTDQSCYTLGGTKAALSIPDMRVWTHTGTQSWWSPIESERLDIQTTDPVEAQFLHFLDVINGTVEPRVTGWDGLRNIEVLDAIKLAASRGNRQTVGGTGGS